LDKFCKGFGSYLIITQKGTSDSMNPDEGTANPIEPESIVYGSYLTSGVI